MSPAMIPGEPARFGHTTAGPGTGILIRLEDLPDQAGPRAPSLPGEPRIVPIRA